MKRKLKICLVGLGIVGLTTSCSLSDFQSAINTLVDANLSSYSTAASLNFVSRLNSAETETTDDTISVENQDVTDLLNQFDLILSSESSFEVVKSDSDRADYASMAVISFVDTTGETVSYTMYYSDATTSNKKADGNHGWGFYNSFGKGKAGERGQGTKNGQGGKNETSGNREERNERHQEREGEIDIGNFDIDGDGIITIDDVIAYLDVNLDGLFDYADYQAILAQYDYAEIDVNLDGTIDETDFVTLFDLDGDQDVDNDDLIGLFDIDGDGDFDADDVLYVMNDHNYENMYEHRDEYDEEATRSQKHQEEKNFEENKQRLEWNRLLKYVIRNNNLAATSDDVETDEEEAGVNVSTKFEGIAIVDEVEYPFFSTEYSEENPDDGSSTYVNSFIVVMNDEIGNESFLRVKNRVVTEAGAVASYFDYAYVKDASLVSSYTIKTSIEDEKAQLILNQDDKTYFIRLVTDNGKVYIIVTVKDPSSTPKVEQYVYERVTTTGEDGEVVVTYVLVETPSDEETEPETETDTTETSEEEIIG